MRHGPVPFTFPGACCANPADSPAAAIIGTRDKSGPIARGIEQRVFRLSHDFPRANGG